MTAKGGQLVIPCVRWFITEHLRWPRPIELPGDVISKALTILDVVGVRSGPARQVEHVRRVEPFGGLPEPIEGPTARPLGGDVRPHETCFEWIAMDIA